MPDSLELDLIVKAIDKASGPLAKIGKGFTGLGKILAGGAAVGTAALAGLGAGLAKLAIDAAPIEGVRKAFNGLVDDIGVGSDEMLMALQQGGRGMIDNATLMKKFNLAAQLVSNDFATQLPEAMQYLSKVSLATGEDMGYLLDSLVRGVGRLSPMILDNMAIQVDLSDAYDEFAKKMGISTDEMTKAQEQTAVMSQVMEKLAANTAAMPDVSGTAMQAVANLGVSFRNLKDDVGLALLPALNNLAGPLTDLAAEYVPRLSAAFEERIAPVLANATDAIGGFVLSVVGGEDPLTAFRDAIGQMLPPETVDKIMAVVGGIETFIGQVKVFVSDHSEALIGALKGIGAAFAIGGVILGVSVAIAALTNPITLVAAAMAVLGAAWETDWGGIRTTLTEFWETTGSRIFEQFRAWLGEHIPVAIAKLSTFFTGTLQPAMQAVGQFISTKIVPILTDVFSWLGEKIPPVIQTLANFWTQTLLPAMQNVWRFLTVDMQPVWEALGELIEVVIVRAFDALVALWENILFPALEDLWDWLGEKLVPVFESLRKSVSRASGWIATITEKIKELTAWLQNLELPDWLTRHSPAPIEQTLESMNNLLEESVDRFGLLGNVLGGFGDLFQPVTNSLTQIEQLMDVGDRIREQMEAIRGLRERLAVGAFMGGVGSGFVEAVSGELTAREQDLMRAQKIYQLIINSNAPIEDIFQDFNLLEALAGS